jgi:predicted Na+-dependent transporter
MNDSLMFLCKLSLGFTAAYMLIAAVGTVVCMPLTVPLLAKGLTASAWAIAKPLLLVVLLPMAGGVAIRGSLDALASKMLPCVRQGSGIAGLVWCALCLIIYGKGLLGVAGMDQRASLMIVLALPIMVIVTSLGTRWLGRRTSSGEPVPARAA